MKWINEMSKRMYKPVLFGFALGKFVSYLCDGSICSLIWCLFSLIILRIEIMDDRKTNN